MTDTQMRELADRLVAMAPEPPPFPVLEIAPSVQRVLWEGGDQREPGVVMQPAWYRRPAIAAVSLALVLVIVIGATALLFGGAAGPVADTTPPPPLTEAAPTTTAVTETTPVTTSVEATTPAVSELTAADLVSVERITDDALEEFGMRIWDLAVGGPGLVAVGEVTTPDDIDSVWGGASRDAVVLVSADGRSWDRVDDPQLFGGNDWDELHAIWSGPSGFIAQGRDAEAPYPDVVWYASADGLDWALITDDALYAAWERQYRFGDTWIEFQEGGPGWVAAVYRDTGAAESSINATMGCPGYSSRECENPVLREILVSSNGIEWESITEPLENLVDTRPEAPPRPESTAWDSEDSHYPWNLAWDDDRVVAVRYHAEPRVGVSPDGGDTWLQVAPEAFGSDSVLTTIDVIRFGDLYIIGGNSFAYAEVWLLDWNEQEDS